MATLTAVLLSTAADGTQGNANSYLSYWLDNDRYVLTSLASNLVPGDTNTQQDIFLKTLSTGAVTRLNVGPAGLQANSSSLHGYFLDADRFIFTTGASNFSGADTNLVNDVYMRTLSTGVVTPVSVTTAGAFGGTPNATVTPLYGRIAVGDKVVFTTASPLAAGDVNGTNDLYIRDVVLGTTTLVSTDGANAPVTGASTDGSLSADGTKLVFASTSTGLVTGDTNAANDVFVKTLSGVGAGTVIRVSTDGTGAQANGASGFGYLSPDGTKVLFVSAASNLVAGDTNGQTDIFVKDLATQAVQRVNVSATGVQANDVSGNAVWSPDGTKVVFASLASTLVDGDTNGFADLFIKTLATGAIERVTAPSGAQLNNNTLSGDFSPDGGKLLVWSDATNLVAGDANGFTDDFVVTLGVPPPPIVVAPPAAPPEPPPSKTPVINAEFSNLTRYQTYGANPPLPATVTSPDGKVLPNPFLADQAEIKALIAKVDAGAMTPKAALDIVVDMADDTTSVANLSYQFFTGHIPTKAGLDYLVSSPENPRDLNDGFYAGMSLENRYINFAVNLGTVGEGRASFAANYGALSLTDATARAYAEIFGKSADTAKIAGILTPERTTYFNSLGGDALGTKAAMVGWLLGEAAKADTGPYAVMNENFLYDLADGVAAYGADLHIYLGAGPTSVGLVGVAAEPA